MTGWENYPPLEGGSKSLRQQARAKRTHLPQISGWGIEGCWSDFTIGQILKQRISAGLKAPCEAGRYSGRTPIIQDKFRMTLMEKVAK
jgi:hypothetical protein